MSPCASFLLKTRPILSAFIALLLVSSSFNSRAQGNPVTHFDIRHIGVREGLANQSIFSLCTDAGGTLWIGTQHGIYTFDGVHLDRFDNSLTEDRKIPWPIIIGLQIDTTGKNLIFASTTKGVVVIDPYKRRIIPDSVLGFPENFLRSCIRIVKGNGNFYWLLNRQGLSKLYKTPQNTFKCQPVCSWPVTTFPLLIPDPADKDAVWIIPQTMTVYHVSGQKLQAYPITLTEVDPNHMGLTQLLFKGNEVWGWNFNRRIFHVNTQKKVIEPITNTPESFYEYFPEMKEVDEFLGQKSPLNCYMPASAGQKLFGTSFGIFFTRENLIQFNTIKELKGREIRGIYPDSANHWLVGSYDGLFCGAIGQGKVVNYPYLNVWDFLPLYDDVLLMAKETPTGLSFYNKNTKQETILPALMEHVDFVKNDQSCLSLCKDKRGYIWAGTYNGLLYAPPYTPLQFYNWQEPAGENKPDFHFVRFLINSPGKGMWAASENGLFLIEYNDELQQYERTIPVSELGKVPISHLLLGRNNLLWVATKGKGLACVDLNAPTLPVKWFNTENGLSNDVICRVESSNNGDVLWLSTFLGLSRFDIKKRSFQNFYEESGLPGNEFNFAASAHFPDGTLMFGGVAGVISFHPDSVLLTNYHLQTIISGVKYFNKGFINVYTEPTINQDPLVLPPYTEYLEIKLGSSEFITPNKIKFRYRMHGLSDLWTYVGYYGEIKFIRLPPGNYVFEAQATSFDGTISPSVYIPIWVTTPYYETIWFKTLLVLVFAGMVYLVYQYRIKQILYEQQIRQRLADDLHDDIGNKLNIINMNLHKNMKTKDDITVNGQDYSSLIEMSKNTLQTLNTMIWSVDPERDRLFNMLDRMHDFADRNIRPIGIQIRFNNPDTHANSTLNLQARHHFILIYQEILTNMVKYTKSESITVDIKIKNNTLYLTISNKYTPDQTVSWQSLSEKRGYSTITRRINRINGRHFWSEPEEGLQVFQLEVPKIFKRNNWFSRFRGLDLS